MAWTLYHKWLEAQADGGVAGAPVDFVADPLKIMLVTAGYAPSQALHDLIGDAIANEVSGTNYTARGAALATRTVTESGGVVTFDADDVTWAQGGGGFVNARYAILYKDSGLDTTSPLIAFADLGGDKGNQAGDLTLQMHADGIITWS